MTSCSEFELLISMQLDGELSPAEAASLENHLHTCAECRALQADFLLLQDDFSALRVEPPVGLVAGAMGRIAAEADIQTPKVTPFPSKKKTYRRWIASAAVFCFLVSAVLLFKPGLGSSPDGVSMANEESAPMQATMEFETDTGTLTHKDTAMDISVIESEPQITAETPPYDGPVTRNNPDPAPADAPPPPAETPSAPEEPLTLAESAEEDFNSFSMPTTAPEFDLRDVPPQSADGAAGATMQQVQPLSEDDARELLLAFLADDPTPTSDISLTALDESRDVYLFQVTYPDGTLIVYEVNRTDGSIVPAK